MPGLRSQLGESVGASPPTLFFPIQSYQECNAKIMLVIFSVSFASFIQWSTPTENPRSLLSHGIPACAGIIRFNSKPSPSVAFLQRSFLHLRINSGFCPPARAGIMLLYGGPIPNGTFAKRSFLYPSHQPVHPCF